jgi:hypothetical protein
MDIKASVPFSSLPERDCPGPNTWPVEDDPGLRERGGALTRHEAEADVWWGPDGIDALLWADPPPPCEGRIAYIERLANHTAEDSQ